MATKKSIDAKASKALAKLRKDVGKQVQSDKRSTVGRLCSVVLLHASNATTVRKAIAAIEERFCDWNDLRISEKRDVIATLTIADVKNAQEVAENLRLVLKDLYQQYNVTNFDFGELSKEIFARPDPIDGEEVDVPTIRDEGLPKHESITGFLDGARLLSETSLLDPALIIKKNDERVYMSVYDNPTRLTAKIVWAVGMAIGILDKDLLPFVALPKLRSMFGEDQIDFVSHALMYYERNARACDKLFKHMREPEDLTINAAPFSVQLGITHEDDHQGGFEPLMPRSEGIGRASKRAKPKGTATKSSRASGASTKRKAAVSPKAKTSTRKSSTSAKKKAVTKKATKKVAKKAAKKTTKKTTKKVAKKAARKVAKKTKKKATKKVAKKTTKKVAKKSTKKKAKRSAKK